MSLGVSSGCKQGFFPNAYHEHPKSAGPWCIGRGGRWAWLVKTDHGYPVTFAIMGDEFARDIAFDATKHRALPRALGRERRTRWPW
jgi:hypothetical protein